MLQNAVLGLNELSAVQTRCDLQQATHGTTLTFEQYRTLLINAATGYDKQIKPNSNGKPRRSVFSSETSFGDRTDLNDDVIFKAETSDFLCDVDSMPDEMLACAMNRRE